MIHFSNVRWKNFLSTGNTWTEFQLDRNATTLVIGENGAGKSTVLDALCFGLFNKPFRKINKPQLVNSVNERGMLVEIEFTIGQRNYKIVRGYKPRLFEIWQNGNMLNQTAKDADYQEELEKNILGLNYTSFTQIVVLGSSTFIPFMQLPGSSRRDVIEDLLDLKIFTSMNILLKEKVQTNKENLKDVRRNIKSEKEKLAVHKKYLEEIQNKNQERIEKLNNEIENSESSIFRLETDIERNNSRVEELRETIKDEKTVNKKLKDILKIESQFEDKTKKLNKEIKFFNDNDHCPTCDQSISGDIKASKIREGEDKIAQVNDALEKLQVELDNENQRLLDIMEVNKEIQEYLEKISDSNNQISSLNKYISKIRKDIDAESNDKTDVEGENIEIDKINDQIASDEKLKEEYLNEAQVLNVAADLLKDKGIKTQIVRQYVPVMNKLINKYLAAMEFFVSFDLDENFEETIKSRHRDKFSYSSFSEGEKMRIDLALLLTWRAIAKMKNSTNTNLLMLDEVFDASLDTNGCDEFLKLLNELGKDTNVFVISHKGDVLQDKFRSVIRFEKHKNFSRIAA